MCHQDFSNITANYYLNFIHSAYATYTLQPIPIQDTQNMWQKSMCLIFVPLHSKHLARTWGWRRIHSCAHGIDSFTFPVFLFCWKYLTTSKNFILCHLWIRLITVYLLCAQEFRQNNALALQFWCLSLAFILWVCAFDASKSQHLCIILSQFTCKSKYAVINP